MNDDDVPVGMVLLILKHTEGEVFEGDLDPDNTWDSDDSLHTNEHSGWV